MQPKISGGSLIDDPPQHQPNYMFFQKIALLLLLAICCLFACQKEEPHLPLPPIPPNAHPYEHLAGEFYVERQKNGGYADPGSNNSGGWSETADAFITCSIEKDSLKVLGFYFGLDSLTQTRFEYRDGVGVYGVTSVLVDFANNYDSIYITYNTPCGTYGSCSTIEYQGKTGIATKRFIVNPSYNIWVEHRATANNVDTQYRKDIAIEAIDYSNSAIVASDLALLGLNLDGESYSFNGFAYHAEEEKIIDYGSYTSTQKSVYWKHDSFYLEQQIITYPQGRPFPVDTVHWLYKGRKN